MEPVGMTPMGGRESSPRRMTEPLPWFFSICAMASSSAFSRSGAVAAIAGLHLVCSGRFVLSPPRVGAATDRRGVAAGICGWTRPDVDNIVANSCSTPATARRAARMLRSAAGRGHVVGLADGEPHLPGLHALLQRLVDSQPAELGEDMVAGHRGGPDRTELALHQLAEVGQSHAGHGSAGEMTPARPGSRWARSHGSESPAGWPDTPTSTTHPDRAPRRDRG